MEIQEALRIMRALADGVNPANGEALMADAVYQFAPVVRAFHRAVGAKTASVPKRRRPPMQANRGLEQKINNNSTSQSVPAGPADSYNLDVVPLGKRKRFPQQRESVVRERRLAVLSTLLGLSVACGGGSSGGSGGSGGSGAGHPGTTPGNYTITVTGAVGSVTRTVEVGLTVQ
jgi:hypothetical protein